MGEGQDTERQPEQREASQHGQSVGRSASSACMKQSNGRMSKVSHSPTNALSPYGVEAAPKGKQLSRRPSEISSSNSTDTRCPSEVSSSKGSNTSSKSSGS